ncbi:hypothetical protein M885DRAFT_587320 [Pelagophyceae sp. CCMP2097]|nr:hypothetical protein M885DRAFT_587320 [Pelagophyceae sp. CCMP2097]|mmetsp:Transcript_10751/g.35763  ORF Transcript_10751/g.35763 Transcript_10751/m.35763 type:complete len:425 (-) Transcript_10751:88-1362(-)
MRGLFAALLAFGVFGLAPVVSSEGDDILVFSNTCWDNDPATYCPKSQAANDRYTSLGNAFGRQPTPQLLDVTCRESERNVKAGGSNASRCLGALRLRKKLDEAELSKMVLKGVTCLPGQQAFLGHTWWDGPMIRVVSLFLKSFKATQHSQCAKLVVWTPTRASERSSPASMAMVREIEEMSGAEVVFHHLEPTRLLAMSKATLFEDYVNRAVLPHNWESSDAKAERESTKHFSDFLQHFVLWRYGGIYFDADQVLLRDLFPLWGLNFEYQWSFLPDRFNNAVQGMRKGENEGLIRAGNKLQGLGCCKGWGNTLWQAKLVGHLGKSYGLPCMAFDPFWLRMDAHHTGELKNPSLVYPPGNRNWLFHAPFESAGDWYDGAFGIHWHGGAGGHQDADAWSPKISPDSYFAHWETLYSQASQTMGVRA